jgi:hypothetical protein
MTNLELINFVTRYTEGTAKFVEICDEGYIRIKYGGRIFRISKSLDVEECADPILSSSQSALHLEDSLKEQAHQWRKTL